MVDPKNTKAYSGTTTLLCIFLFGMTIVCYSTGIVL